MKLETRGAGVTAIVVATKLATPADGRSVVAGALLLHPARTPPGAWAAGPRTGAFSVVEATIPDMRNALEQGRVTSRELVAQYLTRIAHVRRPAERGNHRQPARARRGGRARPRARAGPRPRAAARHPDRAEGHHPHDGHAAPRAERWPSSIWCRRTTRRSRRTCANAGAIIIAKTTLTELANWVAGPPTPMPAELQRARGLRLEPLRSRAAIPATTTATDVRRCARADRAPGVGTAASFWAANVGTETSGSILTPANQTCWPAIKPTVGRISRYGIIPITADQDTAGPMARTVTDAAILMGVLEGGAPDPHDPATTRCASAARPGLHALPPRGRAQGRAHRHSARVLLRQDHAAGRKGGARRADRRPAAGDARRDRGAHGRGRGRSSIRPTSRASRHRSRTTASCGGTCA